MARVIAVLFAAALSIASAMRLPVTRGACQSRAPLHLVRCNAQPLPGESEAAWRRRMSEGGSNDVAEAEDAEAVPASAKKKEPNMATSVDDMNFFGATGGGTLTREGIENARKTRSPALDAMEALQDAVRNTGNLPAAAAAAELQRVIGEAYDAGVAVTSPPMKKAASLLAALETAAAAGTSSDDEDDGNEDASEAEGVMDLDQKLDALFGDGFTLPSAELDLDLD